MKQYIKIKNFEPGKAISYIYAPIISFIILFLINLFYSNMLPTDMYIHQLPKSIIYCSVASLTFYIYLKASGYFKNITQTFLIVLAVAYGLSSYAVLSNTYPNTMLFYAIVPIIFVFFEQTFSNKGYVYFSMACAASLCISAPDSCILFIYLGIFFVIFSNSNFPKRVVDFLHLILCYAFAFLMSFAICIPQLTTFISDCKNNTYPGFSVNYGPAVFLSRFLPGSTPSEYFSYGRGLDLYFGLFFFMLLILYFFNSRIDRKNRLKNFIFIILTIGTLQLTPLMHLIELCLETQASSIYYSILFTFYCLRLSAISLNSLRDLSRRRMIAGLSFSVVVIIFSLFGASHNFMTITVEFIIIFLIMYILGLIAPYFSDRSSTQKLLPFFIIAEFLIGSSIMLNQNILPSSLDARDNYQSVFSNQTQQATLSEDQTSDTSVSAYDEFYEKYYASDMADTLSLIGEHVEITDEIKERYGIAGDFNDLEAFNLRAHILGVDEDVFAESPVDFTFDSTDDFKVVAEGNNTYCIEQMPQTLDDGQITVSYHYNNPDKKHYIIICSFYDYMVEDTGDNSSFEGLLQFTASKNLSFRFRMTAYTINEDALSKVSASLFTDADPAMHKTSNSYIYLIYLIISAIGIILLLCFTIDKGKAKLINDLNAFKNKCCNLKLLENTHYWIITNKVYLTAFILPTAVFIAAMIYYSSAPFGTGSFLDSDGISSVLAANLNTYYNLKDGNTTLSMLGGYANGIFPGLYIIYYLPLLLFSASALPSVFMITDALLLGFSGFSVCYYLTHRKNGVKTDKSDWKLLIPALIYSLNTYMIAMHSYIFWWYLLFALFPILVWLQERMIYEKKWLAYSLLLFFCILTNFNIAFYICIFLVIHFFTCKFDSIKDFIIKGLRFAVFSLLGALCNYNNLVGLFAGLFSSREGTGYAESDSIAPTFGFFTSYFNQWKQFMLFTPCKTITSDNGHINLYMGVFFLLLFALFILCKKISFRQKLRYLIPTIILFISFNEQVSTYMWNGFHYQVGVPNRHVFLFAFIAALIAFEILNQLEYITIKQITISTGIAILFMCTCQFLGDGNTLLAFISTIILIVLYYVIYFIFSHFNNLKKYLSAMMIVLFALEMTLNVFYDCTSISLDNISIYGDYENQAEYHSNLLDTASKKAERFSLPASYGSNNGFIVNAPTGTYFNSFLSNNLQFMNYYYGLYYGHNFIMAHHNSTPLAMALSSCNYIEVPCYSTASLGDLYNYDYFDTINGYFIYTNPDALSLGIYVPSDIEYIPEEALDNAATFQDYVAGLITGNDQAIYGSPIILDEASSDKTTGNQILFMGSNGNKLTQEQAREIIYGQENSADPVFTSHNLYCEITVTPNSNGPIYLYANEFVYLGEGKANETITFKIPYPNKTFSEDYTFTCYTFNQEHYKTFIQTAKSNQLENVKRTDNIITADLDYDNAGYTMFSLPYTTAWKIYIDDQLVEPEDLMNAYLFIKTPAGKHQLKMVYDNSSSIKGGLISISIIFILCIIATFEKKFTKHNIHQ